MRTDEKIYKAIERSGIPGLRIVESATGRCVAIQNPAARNPLLGKQSNKELTTLPLVAPSKATIAELANEIISKWGSH